MADPIINELDADTPGTDAAEFVELFGTPNESLDGKVLVFYNGSNDLSYAAFDLDGYSLDANGYFVAGNAGVAGVDLVFAGNLLQNGADAVALYAGNASDFPTNTAVTTTNLLDAVVYDTDDADDAGLLVLLNAGQPQVNEFGGSNGTGESIQRLPNGAGGARNTSSFATAAPTPGAVNANPPPVFDSKAIYEIQGVGHLSALDGMNVATTGIVTAVDTNGFYIQDAAGDGNDFTSDGIFIFTGGAPSVAVGDLVEVKGTVDEFTPGGTSTGNLSITEIVAVASVAVLSSGNALPAAVVLGAAGRTPPTAIIDNDMNTTFDPAEDGLDFYETLEGMRVTIDDPVAVSATNAFGEIFVLADNGAGATGRNARGGITIAPDDFNPERIQIQLDTGVVPGISATVNVGDTLGDVTGVVSYNFGNFEVVATEAFTVKDNGLPRETTTLVGTASQLTIASYNVENLDPKVEDVALVAGQNPSNVDDDVGAGRFAAIAAQIVDNLLSPDIVALQEMQDNDGAELTAVTDASLTAQTLIDAIVAAGGPEYIYIDVAPADDSSGGQPGGNIRVGFLYNPDRVELVPGSVEAITDAAFDGSRRPLVAQFEFNGEVVTVINNHFSSKGGGTPLFGTVQPPVNGGEVARIAQAEAVNAYVDNLLAVDAGANVVVMGDLNEFSFFPAIDALKGGVLTEPAEALPALEQYSFNFEGNAQALDHTLVSNALKDVAETDIVHVNAEFADQVSDHDPTVTRLTLGPSNFKLQLLHASDLEGGVDALGRAKNFAAIVDALEDDYANTIVLSAGDNYIPGPFFSAAGDPSLAPLLGAAGEGRADIQIMNIIGFEASALGNHEFDAGPRQVRDIIAASGAWQGAQFPYLSSNLDFSASADLNPLVVAAGQTNTAVKGKIAPSTVVETGGERIGVVGATTPLLETISSPAPAGVKNPGAGTNDMDLLASILQPVIDGLVAQGIDKIVLVSHLQQISLEKELIGKLEHVDVVIAGGSDTLQADAEDVARGLQPGDVAAEGYPFVTQNKNGDAAVVVSTDGEYSYVGRLVIEFDGNGDLIASSIDQNVSGAFAATDAQVAALWGNENPFAEGTKGERVEDITDAIAAVVTQKDGNILGKTDVFLEGRRVEVRTEETNLGNLTADANLAYARDVDPTVMVSIKNGGGMRAAIGEIVEVAPGQYIELPPQANPLSGKEAGEVSQLDIENTLRFNNALTLVTVTAEQLLLVIEHAVAASNLTGATPGQFAQVGGLSYSFDVARAAGDRVQSLAIVDDDGNIIDVIAAGGEVVGDADRGIRIVTLNFLVNPSANNPALGGDNYPFPGFVNLDPTFANRVDLGMPANAPRTGLATFAADGTEQDATAEFLLSQHAAVPFGQPDTTPESDERIQQLAFREDTVLDGVGLGTGGNDRINDGFGDAHILALGGDDRVSGGFGNDFIDGGTGNDSLDGGSGEDTLAGGDGNDDLNGGLDDDALFGGDGNDTLNAGIGNDTASGGDGDDTIGGGIGDDLLTGGDGNDAISGGIGDDTIDGGDGNDRLAGDIGDDTVDGGDGRDTIEGGSGSDLLMGGDDADSISGGVGEDTIVGGAGDDTMEGGAGGDLFVFAPGDGADRINDFSFFFDQVDLSAFFSDFAEVVDATVEIGRNTVIMLNDDGDSLTLTGVRLRNFDEDGFVLA